MKPLSLEEIAKAEHDYLDCDLEPHSQEMIGLLHTAREYHRLREALELISTCKPAGEHNDGLGHIAMVDMVILPTAREALRETVTK